MPLKRHELPSHPGRTEKRCHSGTFFVTVHELISRDDKEKQALFNEIVFADLRASIICAE
jgi:hypothetical protein